MERDGFAYGGVLGLHMEVSGLRELRFWRG